MYGIQYIKLSLEEYFLNESTEVKHNIQLNMDMIMILIKEIAKF